MKQLTSIAILCCILTLISCGGQKQEMSEQELVVGPADTVYYDFDHKEYVKTPWYHTNDCPGIDRTQSGEVKLYLWDKDTRVLVESLGFIPCRYCCFKDSEYAPK